MSVSLPARQIVGFNHDGEEFAPQAGDQLDVVDGIALRRINYRIVRIYVPMATVFAVLAQPGIGQGRIVARQLPQQLAALVDANI